MYYFYVFFDVLYTILNEIIIRSQKFVGIVAL